MEPHTEGGRVLRFFVGFLATLAGLVCLVRPGAGVLALLIALSFWFIITGIADLARALDEREHRLWSNTRAFRAALAALGLATLGD